MFLFEFLKEVENEMKEKNEKQVMIEKAINLKLMCDYVVSCSYGDVVLVINMLHDYIKTLDEKKSNNIEYEAYYRKKFQGLADRLSKQIEYDYEEALERCKKKRKEKKDDIGEDALILLQKRR